MRCASKNKARNSIGKEFYSLQEGNVSIAVEQASMFAKEVAHDFNPLHDVDAKRFCVPGDLLFALALEKYGLSQHMHFIFSGMVGHGVLLFDHLDFRQASMAMLEPKMKVNGKRASAYLHFQIKAGENVVGAGFKKLAISVLNGYESEPIQAFVDDYLARKNGYLGNLAVW